MHNKKLQNLEKDKTNNLGHRHVYYCFLFVLQPILKLGSIFAPCTAAACTSPRGDRRGRSVGVWSQFS
jgi:hypothetical protein